MKKSRLAALSVLALAFCQSLPYPVWAGEYALVCSIKHPNMPKFRSPKVLVITSDGEKIIALPPTKGPMPMGGKISHLFVSTINEMIDDGFEPVGGVSLVLGDPTVCQVLYDD